MDIEGLAKKADTALAKASSELEKRYKECDSQGHLELDKDNNKCNYCFRRWIYETPWADSHYLSRKGLSIMQVPLDASVIGERKRKEIEFWKGIDKFKGIGELMSN